MAWALARFGAHEVEIAAPGASTAMLAPLPVHALRLDASSLELLARLGIDIATAEAVGYWLRELTPRLTRALTEAGQRARMVELVAARVDGVPQRLRVGFARPTRDTAHMLRLATRRIEEVEPGYGIGALALHVRRADPLGPEHSRPRSPGRRLPISHRAHAETGSLRTACPTVSG